MFLVGTAGYVFTPRGPVALFRRTTKSRSMDDEIDPDAVYQLLEDDEDVRVVDIRDERSFARGHLPGSENLPFHALPTRVDELAGADRIVTVCPHGKASVQAARLIGSYEGCTDARVESMAGGLDAWAESYDLDVDDGEPMTAAASGGEAVTANDDDGESAGDDGNENDAPF